MKDIKQYTCTLEQAKRLKELGIEQDSLFYFTPEELTFDATYEESQYQKYNSDYEGIIITTVYLSEWDNSLSSIPAFTSQELGELIDIWCDENRTSWHQRKTLKTKIDDYYFYLEDQIVFNCGAISEAEARVAFLIHLLEQNK